MAHHLHVWSDIPGHRSISTEGPAKAHADNDPDGVAIEVRSFKDFEKALGELAYDGYLFDRADIHCHGSPGKIYLGRDKVGYEDVDALRASGHQNGYGSLFKADSIFKLGSVDIHLDAMSAAARFQQAA